MNYQQNYNPNTNNLMLSDDGVESFFLNYSKNKRMKQDASVNSNSDMLNNPDSTQNTIISGNLDLIQHKACASNVVPSSSTSNFNINNNNNSLCNPLEVPQTLEVISAENNNLLNILFELNSANAVAYYNQCIKSNVDETHLAKLTELQMSRMFADNQIGLFVDFAHDISRWKMTQCHETLKTVIPNVTQQPIPNMNTVSLMTIIANNNQLKKKALLKMPGHKKTLTPRERFILLNLIVDYFINFRQNKMPFEDMKHITSEIVRYFDGELETTYLYTECKIGKDGCSRQRLSGKLANKWNNRFSKDIPRKKLDSRSKDEQNYASSRIKVFNVENRTDQEKIKLNLAANQSFPVHVILNDWKASHQLRFEFINNHVSNPSKVFEEWPFYTHSNGFVLVSF